MRGSLVAGFQLLADARCRAVRSKVAVRGSLTRRARILHRVPYLIQGVLARNRIIVGLRWEWPSRARPRCAERLTLVPGGARCCLQLVLLGVTCRGGRLWINQPPCLACVVWPWWGSPGTLLALTAAIHCHRSPPALPLVFFVPLSSRCSRAFYDSQHTRAPGIFFPALHQASVSLLQLHQTAQTAVAIR